MSQQTPIDRLRVLVDAGIALSSELSAIPALERTRKRSRWCSCGKCLAGCLRRHLKGLSEATSRAPERGGLLRSSAEAAVMAVERRRQVIAVGIWANRFAGKSPSLNGRRQPSRDGTSRMNREVQVRICERLGVKLPGPTRQRQTKLSLRQALRCDPPTADEIAAPQTFSASCYFRR